MSVPSAGPFPPGFFDRADPGPDTSFYAVPRLVTHIDEGAVAAVGALYEELALGPRVLDVCSSWVSHFRRPPEHLTVLGLNAAELDANAAAEHRVVADLNEDPRLPFADAAFDDAVCCVSVDYLVRPVEVFAEVARVLRPGGRFVCTWSDRCFPTKAVRGWLEADDRGRLATVAAYLRLGGFADVQRAVRVPPGGPGDPLWACWGTVPPAGG
ncbi:class I SAM-dependent methyltransferase [Vallicoccus soli]|uniref:Class I SAM-dependent methyltransferase n=1 Tax=Vallicoccus soli TaxID=2339232 RepID=A0A3A3Z8X3_9ACTN|nr:methyltransferase domain-containing protein [Vallicoccus soli]RJK97516.1 class I SAM-dependent methyltransferase [Vallicoccus soli]